MGLFDTSGSNNDSAFGQPVMSGWGGPQGMPQSVYGSGGGWSTPYMSGGGMPQSYGMFAQPAGGFGGYGGFGGFGGSPINMYFGGGYGGAAQAPQVGAPQSNAPVGSDSSLASQNTTTTFTPWGPQGTGLQYGWDQNKLIYDYLMKRGPSGFSDVGTAGLRQMANLAGGGNIAFPQQGMWPGPFTNPPNPNPNPNPDPDQEEDGPQTVGMQGQSSVAMGGLGAPQSLPQPPGGVYIDPNTGPGPVDRPTPLPTGQGNPFLNPASQGLLGILGGQNAIGQGNFQSLYNNASNPQAYEAGFKQLFQQSQNPGSLSGGMFNDIASGNWISQPQRPGTGQQGASMPQDGVYIDPNTGPGPQNQPPQNQLTPSSNPYADAYLQNALDKSASQLKAVYGAKGRFGSDAMGEAFGRELGGMATNFNLNRYEGDRNAMMQAAQARSQEDLARQGLGLQAMQGLTGANQGRQQLGLSAAQGLAGVQGQNIGNQMQGIGMAPALNDFRYADANKLTQVGGALDSRQQQQDEFMRQQLNAYMGAMGSLPGSAGVQQTQGPGQSGWLNALGGAGTMAGLGSMFGPLGTLLGGIGGGIGGWLFG